MVFIMNKQRIINLAIGAELIQLHNENTYDQLSFVNEKIICFVFGEIPIVF